MEDWLVIQVHAPSGVVTMSAFTGDRQRTLEDCLGYSQMMNERRAERFIGGNPYRVFVNYLVVKRKTYQTVMEMMNSEDQA